MSILITPEEDISVVLNGTDHIRIQVLSPGLHLTEALRTADKVDDYINARFSYAFDEKYGYLTSFPTNVGTGMRATAIVHLPTLSMAKNFLPCSMIWEGLGCASEEFMEREEKTMELSMKFPIKRQWEGQKRNS